MNWRSFASLICACLITGVCAGEQRIADIREGTNMALALTPDGSGLVVDLMGQLWELPVTGGGANSLTPATVVARNPRFSPDGKFIVYQSDSNGQWDLHVLERASGSVRRLTETSHNEREPDFSADGGSIIFSSDLGGSYDIWEIDRESGRLLQLSHDPGQASFPSVSERGEIVYVNETNGQWSLQRLWQGVTTELLRETHPLRAPSWRPGGGIIVFNEQRRAEESNLRMLLLDEERLTKTLTSGEDVFGFRAAWVSPAEYLYTADGQIWRRSLASTIRQPIQLFAGVAVTRPTHPRRALDFDRDSPGSVESEPYVIQVDRLFDGIGNRYLRHMDIHVKNQRISAVVARGLKPLPEKVIDARDQTIIPGLIDLHTHPSALPAERIGRIWLAYGVTTIREVGDDTGNWQEGPQRRDSWSSGAVEGPRLLLTTPDSANAKPPGDEPGPEYNVFQLYRSRPEQLSPSAMNQARGSGVPIFGQTLFPTVRFGIDALEHLGTQSDRPYSLERSALGLSYQDVFSVLIETRTVVTPTLAAFGGFQALAARDRTWSRDPAYLRLFSAAERSRWYAGASADNRLITLQRTIGRLVQAGGRVAAGSDAPAVPYGLGLHAELALLNEAGIPNDQVLRLVTAEAALALGIERDLGTVEAGKLADFVVLRGSPLTRIEDTLSIEAVVKGGVWLSREQLLALP